MKRQRTLGVAVFVVFLMACASPQENTTLYEQLGSRAGVEKLVDTFIEKIGNDQQIFPYFADTHVSHFRKQFIAHVSAVANGPVEYDGDSMVDIHTGMNISEADFNRVVELLVEAMEKNRVPITAQNRLLNVLAPMRSQIIRR